MALEDADAQTWDKIEQVERQSPTDIKYTERGVELVNAKGETVFIIPVAGKDE